MLRSYKFNTNLLNMPEKTWRNTLGKCLPVTGTFAALMKIAVNTQELAGHSEDRRVFGSGVLKRLIQTYLDHEFLLILGEVPDKNFSAGENVKTIVSPLPRRFPWWKSWYDRKLPAILKKHQAALLLSFDSACSLAVRLPQHTVADGLSFLQASRSFFYRRYLPRFLKKAQGIIATSSLIKKKLIEQYGIPEQKISVVYPAAAAGFSPLPPQDQEAIRQHYTGGRNYFVYTESGQDAATLLHLLKAFSVFKKRQQSNWKLVIAGEPAGKKSDFLQKFQHYKYRDDVIMAGSRNPAGRIQVTGSAYALICLAPAEGPGLSVPEALRCGIPVIASGHSVMEEMAGDAALYIDAGDYTGLADKMMLLYKDEALRSRLVEKAKQRSELFDEELIAAQLWQSLMK